MPFETTHNHIYNIYCSICNPNLDKYMFKYDYCIGDLDLPDECNCYLHSFEIKNKNNNNINNDFELLTYFIKYIDSFVEKKTK